MSITRHRVDTLMDALRRGFHWPLAPMAMGVGVLIGMEYFPLAEQFAWLVWPTAFVAAIITRGGFGKSGQVAFVIAVFIFGFARLGLNYANNDTKLLKLQILWRDSRSDRANRPIFKWGTAPHA